MARTPSDAVDQDRAAWHDDMFTAHPTPYAHGLSRHVELARVREVLKLASIGPSDAVLEIGCEAGYLLAAIGRAKRIVGLDISARALDAARERVGDRAELRQGDAEQALPFARGEFDVILCSEMLEHTDDPRAVLRNIRAIATLETRIVISVPIERPKVRVKQFLHRLGLLRFVAGQVEPHQSEWHVHAFSPRMLDGMVVGGFRIIARRRVWAAHYVILARAA